MNSALVRAFRRSLGMSRDKFARALDLSGASIDRWEGEPDEANRQAMRKLAKEKGREDLVALVTEPDVDVFASPASIGMLRTYVDRWREADKMVEDLLSTMEKPKKIPKKKTRTAAHTE